jgi:succinoglycan biosynthesis transport protein ExoP
VLAIAADSALSVEALQVIPVVSGSSELVGAIGEFTNKRAERRALLYRYTEQHRTVQQLQDEIASLERETIPALVAALIAEVRAREAELQRLIDSAGGELTRIPPRAIDEARLERRVRIATTLFTNLRSRYEEARLAAASSFPDVRILDAAVVPWRSTNAQEKPRLILMAFMASLGFGVLGAVLLDRLDPRVKYPEQLSRELGLPILGTVPHVGRRAYGTGLQNTAQVVEAFRVIRLNLLHAYGTAGPVVITVTSPSPQDGKSFVAANLALAFADLGRRTLVIDGDVRRGSLHRLLGGVRKPGLTDYLAGNATWEQVVHTTAFGSLHRIGCGTRRQDGPELLQSAAMSAFMMQLRANYEAIIVDTPPLEAGVDPLALGTLTGSMLLVVRTGATDRVLIEAKLDVLERLPIRILGAVLNDVPPHGVYKQYYRYYVPGYDSWDEEGTPGGQRRIAVTSVSSAAEVEPAATETEPEPDVGAEIFEAAAVDSTRPDPPEGPDNPRCQASPSTMETGSTAAPKPKSKPKSKKSARRRPKSDGSRPKAVSLDPEAQVADAPPRNPRRRRQIEVSEGGKDSAKRRLTEARQQSTAPGNPKHLLDGYRQYQRRNLVRYWK